MIKKLSKNYSFLVISIFFQFYSSFFSTYFLVNMINNYQVQGIEYINLIISGIVGVIFIFLFKKSFPPITLIPTLILCICLMNNSLVIFIFIYLLYNINVFNVDNLISTQILESKEISKSIVINARVQQISKIIGFTLGSVMTFNNFFIIIYIFIILYLQLKLKKTISTKKTFLPYVKIELIILLLFTGTIMIWMPRIVFLFANAFPDYIFIIYLSVGVSGLIGTYIKIKNQNFYFIMYLIISLLMVIMYYNGNILILLLLLNLLSLFSLKIYTILSNVYFKKSSDINVSDKNITLRSCTNFLILCLAIISIIMPNAAPIIVTLCDIIAIIIYKIIIKKVC